MMMIKKYFNFLNENVSLEEIQFNKDELIEELDKFKSDIISNIGWKDNKVFYKDFQNIEVEEILDKIEDKLGEEVLKLFNVETFLRKIHQILDLKQKSTKRNIRDEFVEYYISIDNRIDTLYGEEKPSNYDKHHNEVDGEKSLITRNVYDKEKFDIQVQLLKLQEWVKKNNKRVAILFEGRDSAGKGSTIKRFTENLNPNGYRVVALGVPTDEEKNDWFGRYEKYLPKDGEIVFFDRSWYNRAVVEPSLGYCTEKQYKDFMENVLDWEESLMKDGLILIKFWFSITKEKQLQRFELRKKSPLKYWKFSPNDAKVVNKWELITFYKNQMLKNTATSKSPWVVVNSSDKRIARLNSMRYVLSVIDYDDKDDEVCKYYPEVINKIS